MESTRDKGSDAESESGPPPIASDDAILEDLVFRCLEADEPSRELDAIARTDPERATRARGMLRRLADQGLLASDHLPEHASSSEDWNAPSSLGRYAIVKRIGTGGMGLVFEAQDRDSNERVAIKVVRPDLLARTRSMRRFDLEIDALEKLVHPSIPRVLDRGSESGVQYCVMEFVDGETIARILMRVQDRKLQTLHGRDLFDDDVDSRTKPGSTSELAILKTSPWIEACVRIVRDLALCLIHAHETGVLHRDIKPANVMLDHRGRVHLVDFGLARADDRQTLTQSGAALGSLAYMPPEQLLGERARIGPPSDIYAVGVLLYELLTLKHPFVDAQNADKTRANILDGRAARLRRRNPRVRTELAEVCMRAMAREPEDRYQTAVELVHDLEAVLGHGRIRTGSLVRRVVSEYPIRCVAGLGATLLLASGAWMSSQQGVLDDLVTTHSSLRAEIVSAENERRRLEIDQRRREYDDALHEIAIGRTSAAENILARTVASDRTWEERYLASLIHIPQPAWRPDHGNAYGANTMSDRSRLLFFVTDRALAIANRAGAWLTISQIGGVQLEQANDRRLSNNGRYAYYHRQDPRVVDVFDIEASTSRRFRFDHPVDTLELGADGVLAAAALSNGEIHWIDVATGTTRVTRARGAEDARWIALEIGPSNESFVASYHTNNARDHELGCWNIATGALRWRRPGFFQSLRIAPDARVGVGIGETADLELFALEDGETIDEVPLESSSDAIRTRLVEFSDRSDVLWFSPAPHSIAAYHIDGRQVVTRFLEPDTRLDFLAIDGTSRRLVSASKGRGVRSRHLAELERAWLWTGSRDTVHDVILERDGSILAMNRRSSPRLRRADGSTVVFETLPPCNAVARLADGRLAFAPRSKSEILIVDEKTSSTEVLRGPRAATRTLAVLPDGRLASAGEDGAIHVWDLGTKQTVDRIDASDETVHRLQLDPSGKSLASGSFDGTVRIWDVESGSELTHFGGMESVYALAFDPTGRYLAAGGRSRQTQIYDREANRVVAWLDHDEVVAALAFSPDGTRLFVGLTSTTGLRVHETKTWCEVLHVKTEAELNRLCVSSDGETVVYGDYSGLVHVIDVGLSYDQPR
ncbi:MAG: protein kinase [Planctomycetes bacterium]|nr:protein kinase [Planctomycetota bacterium]MCB9918332.1 protein kinase [Planctomycetota bacterium]